MSMETQDLKERDAETGSNETLKAEMFSNLLSLIKRVGMCLTPLHDRK